MLSPTSPQAFTPLPHETTLYTSPPRTTLSLTSLNKYPGHEPFSMTSSSGTLYLTNSRIIYLPSTPTPRLQSFAAPILNTHDSHIVAPWIGPNVWTALVQPVQGGGIPAHHPALELKLTFKEGGAYDFHSRYERVKERLQQAVEVARDSGRVVPGDGVQTGRGRGGGALAGVDVANVHLEDLPAYEEEAGAVPQLHVASSGGETRGNLPPPPSSLPPPPQQQQQQRQQTGLSSTDVNNADTAAPQTFNPPADPPPGYEEVQRETVEDELERRLSGERT